MTRRAPSTIILSLGILAGCASMPKVKVGYLLPKSTIEVTLTQTAACTDHDVPILKNDLAITTTYSADRKAFYSVDLGELGNAWSKANSTFEFYDDGRLKSVNTQQTGQAGEAIKAFIALAKTAGIAPFAAKAADTNTCKLLRELAGVVKDPKPDTDSTKPQFSAAQPTPPAEKEGSKALTIVLRGNLEFAAKQKDWNEGERKKECDRDPATTLPDPNSIFGHSLRFDLKQSYLPRETYEKLKPIFGTSVATFTLAPACQIMHASAESKGQHITLSEPAGAAVKVLVTTGTGQEKTTEELTASARVPQLGETYTLPIQRAPLFGENQFELALAESGKVTKLKYAGGGDAAGLFGALSSTLAADDETPVTVADQAKAVQAEADLIYQQQRLVLCQADPANCPN